MLSGVTVGTAIESVRNTQSALRVLAFKWIRILYRCWVDRLPYDESKYLMALQKRNAPLLKHAASPAK
jgi:hypothetical protein